MKKRVIIFLAISLLGQNLSSGQSVLKSIFRPLKNHRAIDIFKASPNLYFIRSVEQKYPSSNETTLSAWDSNGEFLWSRDFNLQTNVVSNKDGTFTGFSNVKTKNYRCGNMGFIHLTDLKMIIFDSIGTVKFDTIYQTSCYQPPNKILKIESGIIIPLGRNMSTYRVIGPRQTASQHSIWKINFNHKVDWKQNIHFKHSFYSPNVFLKNAHSIVSIPHYNSTQIGFEFNSINHAGMINKNVFCEIKGFPLLRIETVIPENNQNWIVIGYEYLGVWKSNVVILNLQGEKVVWHKRFKGYPVKALITKNGETVILYSNNRSETMKSYATVLKIDKKGNIVQKYILKKNGIDIFPRSIIEDGENQFIIVGSKIEQNNLLEVKSIFFERIFLE